ncbi:hypothetical protein [uncultured Propionibacterium sp.]|uniref:hypothetical protein n=1 Tax=uncultured Propionibacterium sp. TaxID=218066 RepID=UPI0029316775|nr:hypothetical protein [uncultured Propionibacterium sp.]
MGAAFASPWAGVETGPVLTRGTTVADVRRLPGRPLNARVLTPVDERAAIRVLVGAVEALESR